MTLLQQRKSDEAENPIVIRYIEEDSYDYYDYDDDELTFGYVVDTWKVGQRVLKQRQSYGSFETKGIEEFYFEKATSTSLCLKHNRLRKFVLSTSGYKLSNLTSLDLSHNQLKSINTDMFDSCKNLRELNLIHAFHPDARFDLFFLRPLSNSLQELSLILPERSDFGRLYQLTNLQKLTVLDASVLDGNRKPAELRNFWDLLGHRLRVLFLYGFNLPPLDAETFQRFKHLQNLTLFGCHITNINPDVFKDRLPSLRYLCLSCNSITQLTDSMFADLSLTKLDLRLNQISDLSPGCFTGLTNLQDLNLRGNKICHLMYSAASSISNILTWFATNFVASIETGSKTSNSSFA